MTPRVLENTSWDAALIPAYIYVYYYATHQTVITCGEHLLRCGIDTSIYIVFMDDLDQYALSLKGTTSPATRTEKCPPANIGSPHVPGVRTRNTPSPVPLLSDLSPHLRPSARLLTNPVPPPDVSSHHPAALSNCRRNTASLPGEL